MNIYKDHYIAYLEKKLSVIPDRYMGKTPLIKGWTEWGEKLPSFDQATIWANQFEESNISIVLGKASGIIALDLDTIKKEVLDIIYDMLPYSPLVKLGAKGETRFFRYHGEVYQKLEFDGEMVLEVLGENKKTTIPPSVHPNGMEYKWKSNEDLLSFDLKTLPLLPPMLMSHIESCLRSQLNHLVLAKGNQNKYTVSGRNNKMSSLCGHLIKERVDLNKAINTLIETDQKDNNPPLFTDPEEFRHTEAFTNALHLYTNHLNTINSAHFRKNTEYEIPLMPGPVSFELKEMERLGKSQKPVSAKKLKLECPAAQGVLGIMQKHILQNSHKEQPAFAMAAALSTMSTILGQRYVFKGSSPNIYTLLLGGSGSGKHAPQVLSHRMLMDCGGSTLLGAGSYVSDASLMDTLDVKPTRLDLLDEASGILKTITSGEVGVTAKMADILCNLWSVSNGLFLGRSMAAKKPTKCTECRTSFEEPPVKGKCYRPNVNLIMATTYTGLEEAVTLSALDKGLLGRFLIFTADEDAILKSEPLEDSLNKESLHHLDMLRTTNIPLLEKYFYNGIKYPVKEVQLTADAVKDYESYFDKFRKIAKDTDTLSALQPIIARLPQQFKKVALCHAAGCGDPASFEIRRDDLKFAYDLCMYNLAVFEKIISNYLFRTGLEKEYKIILRVLKRHSAELLVDELVYDLRPFLKRRRILEILDELVSSSEIERIVDVQNRPGVRLL